jgi:hypothetical protein
MLLSLSSLQEIQYYASNEKYLANCRLPKSFTNKKPGVNLRAFFSHVYFIITDLI